MPIISKQTYLSENRDIIQNKTVLDLACHEGESTSILRQLGAQAIHAIEIREELLQKAKHNLEGPVHFYHGDITDPELVLPLVSKCHTVIALGVLYHLFDHFRFFSYVLKPNIEHCLIETVCGPETLNPEMYWGFERTECKTNGSFGNLDRIPHGTPNLSWIVESAKIFGFDCDWVQYHGTKSAIPIHEITLEDYHNVAGADWPSHQDLVLCKNIPSSVADEIRKMLEVYVKDQRRMILRLYNKKIVSSQPIELAKNYQWSY